MTPRYRAVLPSSAWVYNTHDTQVQGSSPIQCLGLQYSRHLGAGQFSHLVPGSTILTTPRYRTVLPSSAWVYNTHDTSVQDSSPIQCLGLQYSRHLGTGQFSHLVPGSTILTTPRYRAVLPSSAWVYNTHDTSVQDSSPIQCLGSTILTTPRYRAVLPSSARVYNTHDTSVQDSSPIQCQGLQYSRHFGTGQFSHLVPGSTILTAPRYRAVLPSSAWVYNTHDTSVQDSSPIQCQDLQYSRHLGTGQFSHLVSGSTILTTPRYRAALTSRARVYNTHHTSVQDSSPIQCQGLQYSRHLGTGQFSHLVPGSTILTTPRYRTVLRSSARVYNTHGTSVQGSSPIQCWVYNTHCTSVQGSSPIQCLGLQYSLHLGTGQFSHLVPGSTILTAPRCRTVLPSSVWVYNTHCTSVQDSSPIQCLGLQYSLHLGTGQFSHLVPGSTILTAPRYRTVLPSSAWVYNTHCTSVQDSSPIQCLGLQYSLHLGTGQFSHLVSGSTNTHCTSVQGSSPIQCLGLQYSRHLGTGQFSHLVPGSTILTTPRYRTVLPSSVRVYNTHHTQVQGSSHIQCLGLQYSLHLGTGQFSHLVPGSTILTAPRYRTVLPSSAWVYNTHCTSVQDSSPIQCLGLQYSRHLGTGQFSHLVPGSTILSTPRYRAVLPCSAWVYNTHDTSVQDSSPIQCLGLQYSRHLGTGQFSHLVPGSTILTAPRYRAVLRSRVRVYNTHDTQVHDSSPIQCLGLQYSRHLGTGQFSHLVPGSTILTAPRYRTVLPSSVWVYNTNCTSVQDSSPIQCQGLQYSRHLGTGQFSHLVPGSTILTTPRYRAVLPSSAWVYNTHDTSVQGSSPIQCLGLQYSRHLGTGQFSHLVPGSTILTTPRYRTVLPSSAWVYNTHDTQVQGSSPIQCLGLQYSQHLGTGQFSHLVPGSTILTTPRYRTVLPSSAWVYNTHDTSVQGSSPIQCLGLQYSRHLGTGQFSHLVPGSTILTTPRYRTVLPSSAWVYNTHDTSVQDSSPIQCLGLQYSRHLGTGQFSHLVPGSTILTTPRYRTVLPSSAWVHNTHDTQVQGSSPIQCLTALYLGVVSIVA